MSDFHNQILCGDCLEVMRSMPDNYVSSIVTDPPYGLRFMGKGWDSVVPGVDVWREALRVTKPGGYLLAFGGTRTWHRLAVAIEDAGWEIRDSLMWIFGSGFPKSLNVSKSIDRQRYDDVRPVYRYLRECIDISGVSFKEIALHFGFNVRMVEHWAARDTDSQPCLPTNEQWIKLKTILNMGDDWDAEVERLNARKGTLGELWLTRESSGTSSELGGFAGVRLGNKGNPTRDISTNPISSVFDGYGTSLKPSFEPIILAMKPVDGTYANNALTWGQAGMNIDACRVEVDFKEVVFPSGERVKTPAHVGYQRPGNSMYTNVDKERGGPANALGRWPANVLFSHEPECEDGQCVEGCAVRMLDEQSGITRSSSYRPPDKGGSGNCYVVPHKVGGTRGHDDKGGASRFFYCAKASSRERGEGNNHPTVKPLKLMSYLVRLVTPPSGGLILDPFAGSGSTLLACVEVGVNYIGIELEPSYCEIIESRLQYEQVRKYLSRVYDDEPDK